MDSKKAIIIVIIVGIIIQISFIYDRQNISKENEESYFSIDELGTNQWYIHAKQKKKETDTSSKTEGFRMAQFDSRYSSFDIGIKQHWINKSDETSKEIIIALIDTVVDINHEDLIDSMWLNTDEIPNDNIDNDQNGYIDDFQGWNFIDNTNDVSGGSSNIWHGTHCAGTIVAKHNKIGIMGILGDVNVQLMTLPSLNEGGEDKEISQVIEAIEYAEEMGAQICNLSLSFESYSRKLEEVIENSSMIFVVASGNYYSDYVRGLDIDDVKQYPASFESENIIVVGSVNSFGTISDFSNYGTKSVDIVAPGEMIYSTLPGDRYGFKSGTSMATPIVTSILGLYYLENDCTIEQAVEMMFIKSQNIQELSSKIYEGKLIQYRN